MTPDFYNEKIKQYGKTYVRYDGVFPTLVTIDPDLVKSIMVKNFDCFSAVMADINVST